MLQQRKGCANHVLKSTSQNRTKKYFKKNILNKEQLRNENCILLVDNFTFKCVNYCVTIFSSQQNTKENHILMWFSWEVQVFCIWMLIGWASAENPDFRPWARDQSWVPKISRQKSGFIWARTFIKTFVSFLSTASEHTNSCV